MTPRHPSRSRCSTRPKSRPRKAPPCRPSRHACSRPRCLLTSSPPHFVDRGSLGPPASSSLIPARCTFGWGCRRLPPPYSILQLRFQPAVLAVIPGSGMPAGYRGLEGRSCEYIFGGLRDVECPHGSRLGACACAVFRHVAIEAACGQRFTCLVGSG